MRVLGGRHVAFGLFRSFTFSFVSFKVLSVFSKQIVLNCRRGFKLQILYILSIRILDCYRAIKESIKLIP